MTRVAMLPGTLRGAGTGGLLLLLLQHLWGPSWCCTHKGRQQRGLERRRKQLATSGWRWPTACSAALTTPPLVVTAGSLHTG